MSNAGGIMSGKIAVVGSLNMDMVVNVTRMPALGETVLAETYKTAPGGKGANQAFAAARFGGDVYMFGKVGDDQYGSDLIDNLAAAGVNTDGVFKEPAGQTGLAFITVNEDGDNTIIVAAGANGSYQEDELDQHVNLLSRCHVLMVQLEIPERVVFHAVELAKLSGAKIIFNPAPAPECLPRHILNMIDIITPNENELEKLAGKKVRTFPELKAAALDLIRGGVKMVIVTLGAFGAARVTGDDIVVYPSYDVKAIDTTAAGDAFSAALAVALSENKHIDDAILFANKAAALTVTREGAQPSIPLRVDVDSALLKESTIENPYANS